MSIKLQLPKLTDLRPRLTVIGVGGAGCNAINNMIAAGLTGVDFVVANTDAQALAASSAEHRVQLGTQLTEGLGAGSRPEVGEAAAEEAIDELRNQLAGSHMVFIASGMGGGTGTGAAAVVARAARELGILTVAIVTKPFFFEGTRRMRIAEAGVAELKKFVDTLIVIPNQNLFRVANEKTTFAEAFVLADQVLYSGVACIVDLIIKEGLINLDFADVRTVMSGMGTAMMGTGEASGDRRAILAAEEAIANPLLDDVSLRGARGLLLSISGGRDLTLYEVDEAASRVREEVDPDANIIVGATFDESLGDRVRVSIVASGMARTIDQRGGGYQPSTHSTQATHTAPASIAEPAPAPIYHHAPAPAPQPAPVEPLTADFGLSGSHAAPMPELAPAPAPIFIPQPAPQPPAHHGQSLEQDDKRPLYAAHAEPVDPFANVTWSDTQSHGPMSGGHAVPPLPPQPASAAPAKPTREVWQGPNSVLIEETPPVVPAPPAHARAPDPKAKSAPQAPLDPFVAEMPVEVRRSQRRLPEIEDFPAVAQREYRNRTSEGDAYAPPPPPPPPRKPGLFERLAGRGKRADDSQAAAQGYDASHGSAGRGQPAQAGRQRGAPASGRGGQPGYDRRDQDIDLPDVISRERK